MIKGFIGPIGDDLPAIIAIMLALTLFFSGLTFALNTYDEKMYNLRIFKGSLEISKIFVSDGLVNVNELDKLKTQAGFPAMTYGLEFDVGFADSGIDCEGKNYRYAYLVTREDGNDMTPDIIVVCVGIAK